MVVLSAGQNAVLAKSSGYSEVDRIIAIVNDDVIMKSELDKALERVKQNLQKQNTELPPEDILSKQVLERIILDHLQLQLASTSGIRVDDEAISKTIAGVARENGITVDELRSMLEKEGLDYEGYRKEIRRQMILSQLTQRQVVNRVRISPQEVENFLSVNKNAGSEVDAYRLSHILITLPEAASPEAIDKARKKAQATVDKLRNGADFKSVAAAVSEGQQAFEGGDLGWRRPGEIPGLFSDVVASMQVGDISEPIHSPSGFHIIKLTDMKGGRKQHIVTQTHVRHILVRTSELLSDEDARARLEQLKLRIENGEDFATLARSNSEDRGSALNGGELNWVDPGNLVPQFEEAMNNLAPNEISEPFKTQFGWHIAQVLERRQHDSTESFKKSTARKMIRQRKVEEERQAWLRRLRDEAYVEYRLED